MKRRLSLIITVLCLLVFSVAFAVDKAEVYRALEMYEAGLEITDAQRKMLDEVKYDFDPDNELDNAGGPDLYGYYFVDSENPEGPEFDWVDITGTGTEVAVDYELGTFPGAEPCIGPFDIGFDFTFYGEVYDEFHIQARGAISFFSDELDHWHHQLPDDDYGPMICWFWGHLNPHEGERGLVYYELTLVNDQPALVISFIDYHYFYWLDDGSITAQVILFAGSNRILFQYQSIDEEFPVNSATVGIQNDGTVGLNYSYDGDPLTVYEGVAVEFLWDGLPFPSIVIGSVTDINTGDPLPGVEIQMGIETASSNEDGIYQFGWHLAGYEHQVLATLADYYDYHDTVTLVEGLNFYDIEMEQHIYVDVSGYVTDLDTGDPIVGAVVSTSYSTDTTDQDGYYELIDAGLIDSTCNISAEHENYIDFQGQLSLSDELNEYDFQMEELPWSYVSGIVYNPVTGGPVVGAEVMYGMGQFETVISDESGYYEFTALSGETILIIVSAGGYYGNDEALILTEGPYIYDVELEPYDYTINEDFESSPGFLQPGVTNESWEYGEPVESPTGANSPSHCWETHIDTPYETGRMDSLFSSSTWLISSDSAYVSYWHWLDYSDMAGVEDGYNFNVSVDGGNSWLGIWPETVDDNFAEIDALGGVHGWTGSRDWTYVRYDLSWFIGEEVMFMFRHGAEHGEGFHGVAIDDIRVYNAEEGERLVDIDLSPVSPPFIIPPPGGTFQFNASASNNSPFYMNFDIWTIVILPSGQVYGPILQTPPGWGMPGETTIAPGPFTQVVPGYAPPGNYVYEAFVGSYADDFVYCSDRLEFYKQPGPMAGAGYNTWDISGWDFEIESAEVSNLLPTEYAIKDVYPNPFNPVTNINIALPNDADLRVDVYNVNGQLVTSLANGRFNAGYHNLVFDAANLSSGLYFIRATVPGKMNVTEKVILAK